MFVLARESRGMTQRELAKAARVSQGKISKLENGEIGGPPDANLVRACANALGYSERFFSENWRAQELPVSFYRKQRSLPQKRLRRVRAEMNIRLMQLGRLLRSVEVPPTAIPAIRLDERGQSAEEIALELRAQWRIPRGPIDNVMALVEERGVLVFEVDFGSDRIDGVSFWEEAAGLPPVIFVRRDLPGDRLRHTLLHELAHLVLHHHVPIADVDCEEQADAFAAEFLAPTSELLPVLHRTQLEALVAVKKRWGIAMGSIIRRAVKTGKITARQQRYFYVRMSKLGYSQKKEPEVVPKEHASLLNEVISYHMGELGYDADELARALCVSRREFGQLFLGEAKPILRALP